MEGSTDRPNGAAPRRNEAESSNSSSDDKDVSSFRLGRAARSDHEVAGFVAVPHGRGQYATRPEAQGGEGG